MYLGFNDSMMRSDNRHTMMSLGLKNLQLPEKMPCMKMTCSAICLKNKMMVMEQCVCLSRIFFFHLLETRKSVQKCVQKFDSLTSINVNIHQTTVQYIFFFYSGTKRLTPHCHCRLITQTHMIPTPFYPNLLLMHLWSNTGLPPGQGLRYSVILGDNSWIISG